MAFRIVGRHFIYFKFVMDNIYDVNIFWEPAINCTMGGLGFPTKGGNDKMPGGIRAQSIQSEDNPSAEVLSDFIRDKIANGNC